MMPLVASNEQVLKLVNTPKLPANLFDNAQPIPIRVLQTQENNYATILLAGRQIQTQTQLPLQAGQLLSAIPEYIDGQLQLKLIPNSSKPTTANQSAPSNTPSSTNVEANLPEWTNHLPQAAKQALFSLRNTLPGQLPLAQLLGQLTQMLPNTYQTNKPNTPVTSLGTASSTADSGKSPTVTPLITEASATSKQSAQPIPTALTQSTTVEPNIAKNNLTPLTTPSNPLPSINPNQWQTLLQTALSLQPTPTRENIQQIVKTINPQFNTPSHQQLKQELISLIQDPDSSPEEKNIAQGVLNKIEQNFQTQNLLQLASQSILLQELPIWTPQGLSGFNFELEVPKAETPETEQQWKVFIQLSLPEGYFTSRLQIDREKQLRVQLWGENPELSQQIQAELPALRQALEAQGVTIESILVATGKPPAKNDQPAWQSPLIDIHG